MAATCIMKQVEERHVANEITKCIWSPKMDLVAVANIKGQVAMHRLSWQRVWVINAPGEGVRVTGLSWRPDSKVLAVGYSSGEVVLVDIEDSSSVHKLTVSAEVTALSWAAHVSDEPSKEDTTFEDFSDTFLPPLPSLSKTYTSAGGEEQEEGWHEGRLLRDQACLTLLTVGTAAAAVHLYAFGLFHCATVELGEAVPRAGRVLDATPSHDLHLLSCLLERETEAGQEEREVVHATVETLVLACRHRELHALARRYGQIHSLMTYAAHTLTLLQEAWESILLELDHKLAAYARTLPEGGVAADFLDLLVFGFSSPEFDLFLSNQLTEKGLKKLGHSIELSYSNIQKLVLRNVQAVGQALVHHLGALVGLARHHTRFGVLGVEEEAVGQAVREAGSFVLKAVELQQVIDASMTTFKAFLRWLYVVVQRARGESVPEDITRGTQQDLTYITAFLHDALEDAPVDSSQGERRPKFRLERVGQYLKDAPLSCPPEAGPNPWTTFLEQHPAVAEHPLIFPHHHDRSLLQEHKSLAAVLDHMASQPARVISEAITVASWVPLVRVAEGTGISVSQISCPRDSAVYTVVLPGPDQSLLYLARWPTTPEVLARAPAGPGPAHHVEAMPFVFSRLDGARGSSMDQAGTPSPLMKLTGVQFYTEETLSVLAQDPVNPRAALFIQLWVLAAAGELKPLALYGGRRLADAGLTPRDAGALVDASGYRRLEGGPLAAFAVSGSRKVALLLSENRRRVRLFEMEVDEDDDDDEDEDTTAQHESIMNASGASDDQADTL